MGVTSMPATVHIVDDDASFRTSVGRLLRACGYGVETYASSTGRLLRACGYAVETYASADELLKRLPDPSKPGCILLDINMRGVSGPDLQACLNGAASSLRSVRSASWP